ncbi:MAG: hypothetical protein OEY86_00840 [Nitrospira sp.]|nr:hypothetical protein [Nitrospira sp.]
MASADLITGLDILHAVQSDCSEAENVSGEYGSDVKRYVRQAYWRLLGWAPWPWALSPTPGVITTAAKQSVSVSTISAASPAVVTLSATITASQAGAKFYVEGNQSVYRITAHTGGTENLTLDAPYVELETSGSAVIFQDEYTTPGSVLKIWDPLFVRGSWYGEIRIIDKKLFEQRYGRGSWSLGFGPIEAACEVAPSAYSASDNGILRKLRLAPWSEDALNIEYDYAVFHNLDFSGSGDADTPRIPREHRSVLVHLAAYELFVNKDDSKADQAMTKAVQQIGTMIDLYIPNRGGQFHVQAKHSAALGCT